ncbi:MAG: transporter, family, oxalate/formate antiporter [Petroclostridium sp.]|jgi:MFS family permease|uniref:L-lactate MFS transporter n=1 Tax=Petroclostridium xylanilyticum TaxID=1792311 RepID=UPI000B989BEC|nr:OFA family MFS transporter [Petroclostridium xylanilyticum]MBZ4644612.1 sugar phosphate permease [Clostridia bacterium]MDK2811435.1 transporter, family, oxalate/formate antiporter [Petroclostridium sp.]
MKEEKIFGMSPETGRWMFIPLGIIIFMCLGTIYSWSIFRIPLENLFNIGATQSGLPYMLFLAAYAVLMPISGGFIDRCGPRTMIMVGGMAVGIGWILSGYAWNINILAITYGIIAGGGVGIVYGVPIAVISKWFPDKKGLAVGLTLSGFGLSPFVTAPLARLLIDFYGLPQTFKILGITFLIIILLLALPFKFPNQESIIENKNQSKNHMEFSDVDTKKMLKTSRFYGLWICYTIGTLIGLMTVGITSAVGEEVIRLDYKTTALTVSLFAIFNGVGRPLFGWLTDKLYPLNASIISYIIVILSSGLMLMAKEGAVVLYVFSFSLFWLTLGGWLAIAPTATAIFFGPKYYSKNYGFVFTAYGAGAILGVLISGILRDVLGSYIFVFYPIIFLAILGLLIAIFLLR